MASLITWKIGCMSTGCIPSLCLLESHAYVTFCSLIEGCTCVVCARSTVAQQEHVWLGLLSGVESGLSIFHSVSTMSHKPRVFQSCRVMTNT
eukprot:352986-Chlamydomonas_euryale.AAC.20